MRIFFANLVDELQRLEGLQFALPAIRAGFVMHHEDRKLVVITHLHIHAQRAALEAIL